MNWFFLFFADSRAFKSSARNTSAAVHHLLLSVQATIITLNSFFSFPLRAMQFAFNGSTQQLNATSSIDVGPSDSNISWCLLGKRTTDHAFFLFSPTSWLASISSRQATSMAIWIEHSLWMPLCKSIWAIDVGPLDTSISLCLLELRIRCALSFSVDLVARVQQLNASNIDGNQDIRYGCRFPNQHRWVPGHSLWIPLSKSTSTIDVGPPESSILLCLLGVYSPDNILLNSRHSRQSHQVATCRESVSFL